MRLRPAHEGSLRRFSKPVNTNWYVITGAPHSGKTTVLNQLARLGYRTCYDVAKDILRRYVANGSSAREARHSESSFQRIVYKEMVKLESALSPSEIVFLDYALPDNIAFYKNARLSVPPEVSRAAKMFRYRTIFHLDPIPIKKKDSLRLEDDEAQRKLDHLIERVYCSLRYSVIRLPHISTNERVKRILRRIRS